MTQSTSASPITIMAVYGTRPQAIKLAPLVLALRADPRFRVQVVVAGQDREMIHEVNTSFGIVPDRYLDIHAAGQTLTDIMSRTMHGLAAVLEQEHPDAVLVQGDTTITFAASLAAFYAGVTVVHTEAGLRTTDRHSPFPEAANRRLTTQLASLHLTPTWGSRANLVRENVDRDKIVVTGNSVIDSLLITVASRSQIQDPVLAARLGYDRPMVLVTAHRHGSRGEPLRQLGRAIARLAAAHPDHDFVLPIHRNPLVRDAIVPSVRTCPNVLVTEPLPYAQFCGLMERAHVILTDSDGVQEEGLSLGKPVLVMRDTTECPEAVAMGAVRLVGTDEEMIVDGVSTLLGDHRAYRTMARALNPYGDGHAAERSVQAIARHYELESMVNEFSGIAALSSAAHAR